MTLGLEREDNVSSGKVGAFVSLSLQSDSLAIRHASLNDNGDFLTAATNFLAMAHRAGAFNDFSLPAAGIAGGLHLLDKAGGDHMANNLDAAATADMARMDIISIFGTRTAASGADDLLVDFNLGGINKGVYKRLRRPYVKHFSSVQIFQGDIQRHFDAWTFLFRLA